MPVINPPPSGGVITEPGGWLRLPNGIAIRAVVTTVGAEKRFTLSLKDVDNEEREIVSQ